MLRGLDVSNHQGEVDWAQVAVAGYAFAFIKASEGSSYTDPYFAQNWQRCRAAGLVRGAYHFARPSQNRPETEAAKFASVLGNAGGLLSGDLVALDLEDTAVPEGTTAVVDWTLRWLDLVERALGVRPVFYSGRWYMGPRYLEGHPILSQYPLWLAAYQDEPPAVPPLWEVLSFWQETSLGTVPGVAGHCDLNRFFGDAAALAALGKGVTPEEEWANVLAVVNGWAQQLEQASRELADVRDIIIRLRS